jgi:thiamine kinase-like enzyme
MERLGGSVPSDELVSSHGGFHISQLLRSDGELAVVDFDGLCRAPAADDIASYVASLVDRPDDLQRAADTLDVLVDAYGRRPAGVRWYLAAHLLGRARRPFTRLKPGWPDEIGERVAAAGAALEL